MAPVFRRERMAIVLTAAIGSLPIAPPAHVHEVDDHGHEAALVHRHEASHGPRHHDGVIAGTEASLLELDDAFIATAITPLGHPPARLVAVLEPPVIDTRDGPQEYVENLIHGPPRAPSPLRAPPSISRL